MLPDKGPPAPANCGKRLLNTLVDERASSSYARPFASIPLSNDASLGYRDVSYGAYANAINRCARWMMQNLGSPSSLETIAYIGPADIRYQVLCLAAVKAGFCVFVPSPRNTSDIFRILFEKAQVSKLLTSVEPQAAVPGILKVCNVQKFTIPSLEELLDETPVPLLPLDVSWEEYRMQPFLHIHSSGSTGIPKLITIKHGAFSAFEMQQLLNDNEIGRRYSNMRVFVPFPPFHIAGLIYGLAATMYMDYTVVLPPVAPLSADLCNSVLDHALVEFACMPPSIITDLSKNQDHLANLTRLKGLNFAGGPLSDPVGNMLCTKTELISGIGASEWLAVPNERKDLEDWAWFKFNLKEGGLEFRERDEGLFEMVIVRKKELEFSQPVFVDFPDIQEFETKDLFVKHPEKAGLWKYASRLDDIIVFSNGEKLNPVTMEGIITSCPVIKGCVIVGSGRFQAAAILEPKDPNISGAELMDTAWPFVRKANDQTVKHGRISKGFVLLTQKEKPFPRAGKGTIQRASANRLYLEEIDALYRSAETQQERNEKSRNLDLHDLESTKSSLATFLNEELDLGVLEYDEDFSAAGMDSLQVMNLIRAINSASRDSPVEAKHIYDHPSINQLAQFLQSRTNLASSDGYESEEDELKESWLAMDSLFNDLTMDMTPEDEKSRKRRRSRWRGPKNGPVVPPDGGFTAWAQIVGGFLINMNNWGLVNSFGVFQSFYETDLLRDQSASAIAWIGTLEGALLLIVGVISGPLFDAGYFRPVLVIASVGLVFALMMLSLATQYYQIMLTQGILLGVCSGLLYVPSVALAPVYFKHRRGLAVGLSTAGGSIGGVLYPIIFRCLLQQSGFAWATRTIGFIALITLGVAVAIIQPLEARSRRQLIQLDALREIPYVAFMGTGFLVFAAVLVPFFLAPSFASSALSVNADTSFYLLAVLNASQFFGRVIPAWYADRKLSTFGPEGILLLGQFSCAICGFAWLAVRSLGGFIPWLIVWGFLSGIIATLPAAVLPYISPNISSYGTRLGMSYACAGVGFLISTPVASAANAATEGFSGSQIWTGAICCGSTLLFAVTAWEARKRRILIDMGRNGRRLQKKRPHRSKQ